MNVIISTHYGYYKQLFGMAMGSQPAPYLTNIWFSKHDPIIQDNARLYERYMDDILIIITRNRIAMQLEHINSLHPQMNFPIERESDSWLPFLDLCIVQTECGVYTT